MFKPLLDENRFLTGKRVLNLRCGQERHTRQLQGFDHDYVFGVDINSEIISLVLEAENNFPKGVNYMVADTKETSVTGKAV